jgi:hypothetical protein
LTSLAASSETSQVGRAEESPKGLVEGLDQLREELDRVGPQNDLVVSVA